MESILIGVAMTLANTFVGWQGPFFHSTQTQDEIQPEGIAVEYKCEPFEWVKKPGMVNGSLEAEITAACSFKGNHGGGYPTLNKALMERVVREAHKIHRGPVEESYKELPSRFYDVTYLAKSSNGDEAKVRNDVHIGSNETDRLVFDTFSTAVEGSGNFKYLQKVDIRSEVTNAKAEGFYNVKLGSFFRLKKPWYAPTGVFISEVTKQIEKQIPKTEEELITELANNI